MKNDPKAPEAGNGNSRAHGGESPPLQQTLVNDPPHQPGFLLGALLCFVGVDAALWGRLDFGERMALVALCDFPFPWRRHDVHRCSVGLTACFSGHGSLDACCTCAFGGRDSPEFRLRLHILDIRGARASAK